MFKEFHVKFLSLPYHSGGILIIFFLDEHPFLETFSRDIVAHLVPEINKHEHARQRDMPVPYNLDEAVDLLEVDILRAFSFLHVLLG